MRVAFVPRSAEIQPLFWRFVTFIHHQHTHSHTPLKPTLTLAPPLIQCSKQWTHQQHTRCCFAAFVNVTCDGSAVGVTHITHTYITYTRLPYRSRCVCCVRVCVCALHRCHYHRILTLTVLRLVSCALLLFLL